jgi:hypothetical protein
LHGSGCHPHPRIRVSIHCAIKGATSSINGKVLTRADRLEEQVVEAISKAVVEVRFLGARELVDSPARKENPTRCA